MRRVAAAPTDIYALLSAGELSIKLDDMSAAAAFFARVEKIDPRNGRAKAGMAAILVRAERPGEALRYFQMAEGFGHPASRFASDRGLAYDLLGEQERAQRDYRVALRDVGDDETIRRYALSLGISGRQALALEQLEPLTRRQDRAAWRVRAFVLAMNGDVAGASTIAVTMMPRGMAGGLQPFFERLPSLPAADRAFAVHFGEVRPTLARLADLRMKPSLGPLGPDLFPPVQVALARPATPPVALASRADRGRSRTRVQRRVATPVSGRALASAAPRAVAPVGRAAIPAGRSVLAATAPRVPVAVAPVAARVPIPVTVERRPEPVAIASVAPTAIDAPAAAALQSLAQMDGAAPALPGTTPTAAPVQVASAASVRPGFGFNPQPGATPSLAAPAPVSTAAITTPVQPGYSLPGTPVAAPGSGGPVQLAGSPPPVAPEPIRSANVTPAPFAGVSAPAVAVVPSIKLASSIPAPQAGTVASGPVQVALAPQPAAAAPAPVVAATPGAGGMGKATPGFASLTPAPAELAAASTPAPVTAVRSEDSILARIVASITIPGEELGVVQPARRPATNTVPPATAQVLAAGEAKAASQKADRAAAARTIAAARKPAVEPKSTGRGGRLAAADPTIEAASGSRTRRGGRTELAAKSDVKPLTPAEKRLADRKKAADEKVELAKAEKAKGKGEPERIWVQVAGGASESDLPRAWSAAQKKAAVLKGRPAYITPLRATNRVVTGPFKTDAEARAFVNQLAKQGVSAFQFTSATGQKMTKLSAK